jgi:uncharacterized protein (DUF4415 family)
VIFVSRGATHRDGRCNIDTPKTNKARNVVVLPRIRQDVLDHLEHNVGKGWETQLFGAAEG